MNKLLTHKVDKSQQCIVVDLANADNNKKPSCR